jgi:amino acid permease
MFGTAFLMLPLCFLKNISKMRFASMFGICALIYAILVVIIQTPWFFKDYLDKYDENDSKTHANWFNIKKGFNTQLDFFTGMATVFFCYTCHPGAFPVYKTLKKNNKDKINTVFFRSICLDIIIYILVTICGFMTAPTNPQELIIYRKSVFENDIFMTIAKIALAIDLFLCLPANYASYRCSFFMVFFKTDEIDNFRNCLVTIPTLLVSTLIGALYKDILDYISLFGGFCSTIICYMIPGVLMILTSNEKVTSFKNILTFLVVACLATFGFMGGVQTLRKIITKK